LEDKYNIETLNRLGRAYLENGDIDKASETFKKVVNLDKYNPIARKNLQRIKTKSKTKKTQQILAVKSPINTNFLEEAGRTKSTQLVRLADAEVIANLTIGESLNLEPHKRAICVRNMTGVHIGALPDDLALRIGKLIRSNYQYEAFVKSVIGHNVQIFIREVRRGSSFRNAPSFPSANTSNYHADIRHANLEEAPVDIRETGEED
jgi:hypothetical protein